MRDYGGIFIGSFFFIALASCMVLIVLKVRKEEKDAANDDEHDDNINDSSGEQDPTTRRTMRTSSRESARSVVRARMSQQDLLYNKKAISRQAWAYTIINLFNYFMIFALPIARNLLNNPIPPMWFQTMVLVLRPVQGLFNCIIFIYHKVDGLKKNDPSLELWLALKMTLRGEEGVKCIVSDLTLVKHHAALAQLRFADDVNVVEHIVEEDVEEEGNGTKDEENGSSHSRIGALSSSPRRTNKDDASSCNQENEQPDYYREERLSPISATAIANENMKSMANWQDTAKQMVHDSEDKELYRHYHYSTNSISGQHESVLQEDEQDECSHDLSGFQSSSQPLSPMPDSMSRSLEP